jgi:phage tail-like protein
MADSALHDANGLRWWQLADATAWPDRRHAVFDAAAACGVPTLHLASERVLLPALPAAEAFAVAQAALDAAPRAVDALECVASWDAAIAGVVVRSALPDDALLLSLSETPTDMAVASDGVLLVALPGGVLLHDLRSRWADVTVSLDGFTPWRLAPDADGGAWVLERTSGRLARLQGRPLRSQTPGADMIGAQTFRPCPENGNPPRLVLVAEPVYGVAERVVAIAGGAEMPGQLLLLCWLDGDGTAAVRRVSTLDAATGAPATSLRPAAPEPLAGAAYAYALALLAAERFALRVPGRRDAPAFALPAQAGSAPLPPLGDIYPLVYPQPADAREAGFAGGWRDAGRPPHYPVGDRASAPLHALSHVSLARSGEARNWAGSGPTWRALLVDSGDTTTVWHRLHAEAAIPPNCGFVVWLAATNDPLPPDEADASAWHPHAFGAEVAALDAAARAPQVPRAAWERHASEVPGHPGLLGGERVPGRRGLFGVLVQASRQRTRRLAGRWLWLRLALRGDGRSGPDIAALRVSASRFDYAERYLPRVYRETEFGEPARAPGASLGSIEIEHAAALDGGGALGATLRARLLLAGVAPGPAAAIQVEQPGQAWLLADASRAWRLRRDSVVRGGTTLDVIGLYRPQATPADFTARLLANFEGVLTQMEDRVAAAHLFSDPQAVPEPHLDWLAGWIGVAFDPALPAERRREWLRAAPDLARRHGTREGLRLALDVATGGAVRGGEVLVVEDFRLRRVLATLLGVDLVGEHDPLLPGLRISGNSVVGDTLIVGGREGSELAALFAEDATFGDDEADAGAEAAALAFLGRLAHRATVLVHRQVDRQDFALIRRVVQMEAPAHVQVRVVDATWPLLAGVSSLLGVDTYLGPPRPPRPVQVQRTLVGLGDRLIGAALLDPRLSGNPAAVASPPPVADAGADLQVPDGLSFQLDGSGSRAVPPRVITQYRWQRLPPADD